MGGTCEERGGGQSIWYECGGGDDDCQYVILAYTCTMGLHV